MVSFLQLAVEKKAPFLVHPKQIFGSSYFVRTGYSRDFSLNKTNSEGRVANSNRLYISFSDDLTKAPSHQTLSNEGLVPKKRLHCLWRFQKTPLLRKITKL